MSTTYTRPQDSVASKAAVRRQYIACAIAVGIMALGGWALTGQQAPYHPDLPPEEVTRTNTDTRLSDLTD